MGAYCNHPKRPEECKKEEHLIPIDCRGEDGALCEWLEYGCPECHGKDRYQDKGALDHGFSIIVCRTCGHREFDD